MIITRSCGRSTANARAPANQVAIFGRLAPHILLRPLSNRDRMSIVLGPPTIETSDGRVTYRVAVDGFPAGKEVWFSVPVEASSLVNARTDAALVALLMPAMAAGRDIFVEGPVTDELAWNLKGEAQEVVRRVRPELSRVNIEVRHPLPTADGATGVATGYSAGVDSYAALARHYFATDMPDSLRLTHLLYNNVGSHGHGDDGLALYRKRLELVRPSAVSTGLPLIDVDSNIDEYHLAVRIAFQPSHTMRNAAVAHLLSAGIRHYLVRLVDAVRPGRRGSEIRRQLRRPDPAAAPVHQLPDASLVGLRHGSSDQGGLDRRDSPYLCPLDVCARSTDGTNCAECPKCQRTHAHSGTAGRVRPLPRRLQNATERTGGRSSSSRP